MKTASFSFVAKFPAKKVKDCFTNPAFAKLHSASKLFSKAGIIKTDKTTIIRTVILTSADKLPVIAVINFTDADAGKSTAVEATFVNVPDDKVVAIKNLGKTISAEIAAFYAPKAPKAPAKKAAKKPVAKKVKAKKTAPKAAKPAAKKLAEKKPAAKKAKATKAPAKKTTPKAAKEAKPVAKKSAAKKAVIAPPAAPVAKPADKPAIMPETSNPVKI